MNLRSRSSALGRPTHSATAVVVLVLCIAAQPLRPQVIGRQPPPAPAWRYTLPPTPAAADQRTTAEIAIEDRYADHIYGASDPLDQPQHYRHYFSGHHEYADDFPAEAEDEVLVAHFSTWTPHLSGSRRSIYTTVHLVIDRVVKDKTGQITAGSIVPLFIPGGTITVPGTDKVISNAIRLDDFPLQPKTKYLLFLATRPEQQLPFFEYLKAWNVDKGVLSPVSEIDTVRASRGDSPHSGEALENAIHEIGSHR